MINIKIKIFIYDFYIYLFLIIHKFYKFYKLAYILYWHGTSVGSISPMGSSISRMGSTTGSVLE